MNDMQKMERRGAGENGEEFQYGGRKYRAYRRARSSNRKGTSISHLWVQYDDTSVEQVMKILCIDWLEWGIEEEVAGCSLIFHESVCNPFVDGRHSGFSIKFWMLIRWLIVEESAAQ
jgi:hypothetical protein